MTVVTRNELFTQILPALEKEFGMAYAKHRPPEYVKRHRYGKYSIYRWDYDNPLGERRSTTIATGLDDATAKGMMKLLEEPK